MHTRYGAAREQVAQIGELVRVRLGALERFESLVEVRERLLKLALVNQLLRERTRKTRQKENRGEITEQDIQKIVFIEKNQSKYLRTENITT